MRGSDSDYSDWGWLPLSGCLPSLGNFTCIPGYYSQSILLLLILELEVGGEELEGKLPVPWEKMKGRRRHG